MGKKRMTRDDMMNKIDALYSYAADFLDEEEAAWNILMEYNADESEHDPEEGFFATMSNGDMLSAIQVLEETFLGPETSVRLREHEIDTLRDMIAHYPTSSGSESKIIEFISEKLG